MKVGPIFITVYAIFLICPVLAQEAKLKIQSGHGMVLSAHRIALSPDSKYLASSGGNTILWDIATGREIRTFNGTSALDISPDGKYLTAAVDDSTKGIQKSFKVWEIKTGKVINFFGSHNNAITAVIFTRDGKKLISTSSDQTVKVWDFSSAKNILTLSGHKSWVTCVAVSHDNRLIATGSGDKIVKLWEMESGRMVTTFKKQEQTIREISFSTDDSHLLASSSGDGKDPKVLLFDIRSGAIDFSYAAASPVCFSHDSKRIFGQDQKDKSLIEIDIVTKEIIHRFSGHKDYLMSVQPTMDGRLVATCSQDKTIKLWDIASGRELKVLQGVTQAVHMARYTPDDSRLITLNGYNDLQIWDAVTISFIKSILARMPVTMSSTKTLAVHSIKGSPTRVNLIDVAEDKILKTLTDPEARIEEATIGPDGLFVFTGHSNGKVKIWDASTGQVKNQLQVSTRYAREITISPDGKTMVCVGDDESKMQVWDLVNLRKTNDLKEHQYRVTTIDISPDGKFFVSGSSDGYVKLWDLDTRKMIYSVRIDNTDGVTDLTFSPDGHEILCSTFGNDIKVIEPTTGKVNRLLRGHQASVFTVSYSHNERNIISGSDDGEIKIWNAVSGEEILSIVFLSGSECDFVAYTPDGYYMSSKGGTRAVHFIKDDKVYFFDQFDLQYNRPDILLERMGKAPQAMIDSYRKAYEKRLKRLGFRPDNFQKERDYNVPQVTLPSGLQGFITTTNPSLSLDVTAKDKKYRIERLSRVTQGSFTLRFSRNRA